MELYEKRIAVLLARMKTGVITDSESAELMEWTGRSQNNRQLYELWLHREDLQDNYNDYSKYDYARAQKQLERRIRSAHKNPSRRRRIRIGVSIATAAVAAALFIMPGTLFRSKQVEEISLHTNEKIMLYLDGKAVELETATLVAEGSNLRSVDADGTERVIVSDVSGTDGAGFATVVVPKGRIFEMTLGDGSRIWLNAGSQLRYPLSFSSDSRVVELVGEGYFDVAADSSRPFRVVTKEQRIEVLGTRFNIRAYTDEVNTYTTVVTGKVRVSTDNNEAILTSAMQAVSGGGEWEVRRVDTDDTTNWIGGIFTLEGKTLEEVMTDLARWYDFDISYDNDRLRSITFKGSVPRYESFNRILNLMQKTEEVGFIVDGRKVKVTNY